MSPEGLLKVAVRGGRLLTGVLQATFVEDLFSRSQVSDFKLRSAGALVAVCTRTLEARIGFWGSEIGLLGGELLNRELPFAPPRARYRLPRARMLVQGLLRGPLRA